MEGSNAGLIILLLLVLFVVVGVAVVIYLKNMKKSKWASFSNQEKVDKLMFVDLITFFKQTEIIELLNKNANYIAAAIREKTDEGWDICLTVFDKEASQLIEPEKYAKLFHAKSLDDDTIKQFGDKDMIVVT